MSRPTICLAMIVRDESAVIGRCLESVTGLIDRWVIVDTGSTDRTRTLIPKIAPAPGELHEHPWVNFGHNRSELLQLAKGKADYLLILDADMTVEQTGPWPDDLPDACLLCIPSPDMDYRLPLLIRGDLGWRSVGATHEYLTTDDDHTQAAVDHLVVHHHLDGGARAAKFERDRDLLRAEWERGKDPRTAFYLAQTYRDLGDLDNAAEWYSRRAKMKGFIEETFCAKLELGKLLDWPGDLAALIDAWQFRPERLEPLYEIVTRLRRRGDYRAAHALVVGGLDREPPDDVLFVASWVYRWGLLFEYSITSYWTGDYRGSAEACDRLLELDDLPLPYREQTQVNREHAIRECVVAAA